jgi:hypothetical protein
MATIRDKLGHIEEVGACGSSVGIGIEVKVLNTIRQLLCCGLDIDTRRIERAMTE